MACEALFRMVAAALQAVAAWPRRLLIGGLRAYRWLLSPWLGSACRFEPTCSLYAIQALERHGALAGSGLAAWRVLRCHPWCQGGCDPVPDSLRATPGRLLFPRSLAGVPPLFTGLLSQRRAAPEVTQPPRGADDAGVSLGGLSRKRRDGQGPALAIPIDPELRRKTKV